MANASAGFRPASVPVYGLSLWEPWASLMALGYKHFETRSWPAPAFLWPVDSLVCERPWLLIQAAKRFTQEQAQYLSDYPAVRKMLGPEWRPQCGLVLSAHRVRACYRVADTGPAELMAVLRERVWEPLVGDFSTGRYAWHCPVIKRFERPFKLSGMQGVWRLSEPTAQAVLAELTLTHNSNEGASDAIEA